MAQSLATNPAQKAQTIDEAADDPLTEGGSFESVAMQELNRLIIIHIEIQAIFLARNDVID